MAKMNMGSTTKIGEPTGPAIKGSPPMKEASRGSGSHGTPSHGKSHNAVKATEHDPRSAKGAKTGGMKGGKW